MIIKRGDIILANLNPIMGSEQGKIRPCVVIQNDVGNKFSPTTIIAPMTSQIEKEYLHTVLVEKGEGNLQKDSLIELNQIRTISIQDRAIKILGKLKPETMEKVNQAIKISLGLIGTL